MKSAAKVFIIIGMILMFFLVFPVVVGFIALKRIDEATSVSELKTISILTLIFCSTIGGILMLSMKDEDLNNKKKKHGFNDLDFRNLKRYEQVRAHGEMNMFDQVNASNNKVNYKSDVDNLKVELDKLKRLKETDVISDEEYQSLRKGIIQKYSN